MRLYGVTTTYNNERMVPYVMKYAEWLGYTKIIVYDNGSTDRTVDLLKQYPFVEVRTYETEHFCELEKLNVKLKTVFEIQALNENSDIAWVTICDFDEVYFYQDGLIGLTDCRSHFLDYLLYLSQLDYNVCTENFIGVVSEKTNYDENVFLHKQGVNVGYQAPFIWNKPNLFRLDNLDKIYMGPGQHYGEVSFINQEPKQFFNTKFLLALHLKFAFGKDYVLEMTRMYNKRGCQGAPSDKPTSLYKEEWIGNAFDEILWSSVPIQDFIKHKWLNGDDSYEHLPPRQFY